jgi:hypothetical protein
MLTHLLEGNFPQQGQIGIGIAYPRARGIFLEDNIQREGCPESDWPRAANW